MRAHKAQGHRSVDSKDKSRNGHASGRLDERYNFYLPVCSENVELVYASTVHGCIWIQVQHKRPLVTYLWPTVPNVYSQLAHPFPSI